MAAFLKQSNQFADEAADCFRRAGFATQQIDDGVSVIGALRAGGRAVNIYDGSEIVITLGGAVGAGVGDAACGA